jgi:hypothetical protein
MTDDTDDCSTAEVNGLRELLRQAYGATELDKFREAVWKYKALYYKDICF